MLKNRDGRHEDGSPELRTDTQGSRVGEPQSAFKGPGTGSLLMKSLHHDG